MNALSVTGVSSGYGNRLVIRGISLEVDEGSVVSIVGPNGHGKSTLLGTISGLIRTRSGKTRAFGSEITGMPADRIVGTGISLVPQGDLLFPQMTVHENLLMGAYLTRDHALIRQRLELVHSLFPKLSERADQRAGLLSGGERRMVGIGRGLMTGARLLMLDEPSLGLAPIVVDQIYESVRALSKEGLSILLVEENPERAASVSSDMYFLSNGAITLHGEPADLLARGGVMESYFGT